MRKVLLAVLFIAVSGFLSALPKSSCAAATPAQHASQPAVALTPQQARDALSVLDDPGRRAQVEDTLRAVAAAGALASPAQSASAPQAASAAATPASGASGVLAHSLTANGLASQLSRQAGHWLVQTGRGIRQSASALLDFGSVASWWRDRTATAAGRDLVGHVTWTVLASL